MAGGSSLSLKSLRYSKAGGASSAITCFKKAETPTASCDLNPSIITCHENGEVNCYALPSKEQLVLRKCYNFEPKYSLESKGGPIQTAAIEDVTRLHNNDLIIGDSKGTVTIFCNHQILRRKSISNDCIQCITIQKDALGNVNMLTGDKEGHITAFSPYTDIWRLRLTDVIQSQNLYKSSSVMSLLSVDITSVHGQITNYVLATDDTNHMYFILQGTVVKVLPTPSLITSMVSGRFVSSEDVESGDIQTGYDTQIALGSRTGAIYIMSNFQIFSDEYANIKVPIKQMTCLKAGDTQVTDSLLCCGAFNGLSIVREAKEFGRHKTDAWVESITIGDVDNDGVPEIILGCQNNKVQTVKLSF